MLKVNNLNNYPQNINLNEKIGKSKSNNLKNISVKNNTKFVNNLNEIVLLQSKPLAERTEKEIYRYQKLLRINESLLKTYLSGLIRQ